MRIVRDVLETENFGSIRWGGNGGTLWTKPVPDESILFLNFMRKWSMDVDDYKASYELAAERTRRAAERRSGGLLPVAAADDSAVEAAAAAELSSPSSGVPAFRPLSIGCVQRRPTTIAPRPTRRGPPNAGSGVATRLQLGAPLPRPSGIS